MAKGRFEADKGAAKSAARSDPFAVKDKPAPRTSARSKLWPILAAVAGVAVLVIGILILSKTGVFSTPEPTAPATTEPHGMSRAELENHFNELDSLLKQDLTLTLTPEPVDPDRSEEPILLTLTATDSGAGLDLTRMAADLNAGTGKQGEDNYLLDPRDYLLLNEEAIRAILAQAAETYGTAYAPSSAQLEDAAEDALADDAEDEENGKPEKYLVIQTGSAGRDFTADQLFDAVKQAYESVLTAEDPETALQPGLRYRLQLPDAVDVDVLCERFCKEPENASLDPDTGDIIEGKNGFGFDRDAVAEELAAAEPGTELRIPLTVLSPEIDADSLRECLFRDVIGEAHTNHTNIFNRTNNLKLACKEIDGTIVMPGETFSFNQTVGQRTEEKGYLEAIAYVHGGESKPEVGGGICQVASSIYYAVLQADLNTVEREPHMFMVDYVPSGMDATIYWGYLDYKFENTSPYPIKIEASVSGGKVHIILHGTEWKDYTVELSYEVLETEAWKTVEKEVANDGTYYKGEVITTPYTGYKIATYKTTRDRETGKKLETTQITISRYKKRDKVIANPTGPRVNPQPKPTQPKPTEPKPTQPKPTQPKPTEPKPTQPAPTQPTTTAPPEPSSDKTEPVVTEPPTPPVETTKPAANPTEPSSENNSDENGG